jgi:hypothetical protein
MGVIGLALGLGWLWLYWVSRNLLV